MLVEIAEQRRQSGNHKESEEKVVNQAAGTILESFTKENENSKQHQIALKFFAQSFGANLNTKVIRQK